jgi:hypothetical protein
MTKTHTNGRIKKVVGMPETQDPLDKLDQINRGLRNLGCKSRETGSSVPRKIVGGSRSQHVE